MLVRLDKDSRFMRLQGAVVCAPWHPLSRRVLCAAEMLNRVRKKSPTGDKREQHLLVLDRSCCSPPMFHVVFADTKPTSLRLRGGPRGCPNGGALGLCGLRRRVLSTLPFSKVPP